MVCSAELGNGKGEMAILIIPFGIICLEDAWISIQLSRSG